MLLKGDKIKLIKEIGGFNKVGEIFEIVDILDNGTISFRCWFGTGLMSYDEFEKYFEKVIIRQWSKWSGIDFDDEGATFIFGPDCEPYHYRTNGKKIELRSDNKKVSASCNDCDRFDLTKGLQLCFARMKVKEIVSTM